MVEERVWNITLHYITLHYITLHYITLHYITLHYIRLKKINAMSQSCRAHLISVRVWFSKIEGLNFFSLLNFFFQFLWTCLSKYTWKDMTDTIEHFKHRLLQHCVLSCILFIQKSSSIFQSCDWLKSDTSAAQKKKKKKKKKKTLKKPHLGQVFQSVMSFET